MEPIHSIFFSNSSRMKKIQEITDEIAKTDITVLIKGESGTGKELLAEAIHLKSDRSDKPFIKVNCAAIPKGLLESELFGFEKGAFTGAQSRKPGKFELANGGTILLNDIGEIDISVQAKLLQVLQDGAFSRLGGNGDVSVNTRVLTTTKDNLERSMSEGKFREDLFFRINVMSITLPPLRDRREQVLPLSEYFFDLYKERFARSVPSLSTEAIDILKQYRWPGNVRELENVIKRIVLFGEDAAILQIMKSNNHAEQQVNSLEVSGSLGLKELKKKAVEAAEIDVIQNTLQGTHWNRKKAAKLLGVSYKGLLYKIQKYGLNGHE
jgi:transcriptional regulator with PAS, ATPase and Fis domain